MDLEEIARENAILKTVLNHTDEAVHIIDCDGITRFYNKVASEMEGMDPEEVLGRHILEVYPSLTLETSSLLKVLQTGKPVFEPAADADQPQGPCGNHDLFHLSHFSTGRQIVRRLRLCRGR